MTLLARPHAFERGDKVYLTTPLTLATPSEQQIEEYAFASAVKSLAPNEHIGWLSGRYVEGGKSNLNNAMWLNSELAMKSLTPMLMPVTVMHDPRTAVGTIADCKLIEEASSRIDTILGIWRHRFPDVWEEAEANLNDGTLMQSMECLSPSYLCSECGQAYIKLPEGKERASWCTHLQQNSSHRILQDVCFTGTGLIFGTRGGKGAYTEAYLSHFQDEIAEYHDRARIDSTYRSSGGTVATVTIEQSELDALRNERNDARTKADDLAAQNRDLTTKVETAEAATATEKERADREETARKGLEEKAQSATLKETRIGALGQGFLAKLGDFTRERLNELASTLSDEDWDVALREREELAGVKRDATVEASGAPATGAGAPASGAADAPPATEHSAFSDEEVASFAAKGVAQPAAVPAGAGARALARSLSKARKPQPASKS